MPALKKIGSLDVAEVPGSATGPTIIIFHGYGANAYDLFSLAKLISVPPGTTWLFVNGVTKAEEGGPEGRAWFPLDVKALDDAMREGRHLDFSTLTPPGLKQTRERILDMIHGLKAPPSRLALMGFSQGAMVATDVALRLPEKIAGLAILSGNMINKDVWKEKAPTKVGLSYFQSHGTDDPLLSVEGAESLHQLLAASGLKGEFHLFRGGHEVNQEVIHKLGHFFKKIFSPQN